ncbi:hypothetical protein MBLNU459_g0169t1 [Dothideomycetes sp. NU459]
MPPTHQPTLQIHMLPPVSPDSNSQDPASLSLIAALRSFRLHALQTSPSAFASSHEYESQYPDSEWRARLSDAHAVHYIATLPHSRIPHADADADEIGNDDGGSEQVLLHYQFSGTFVSPRARGRGVGGALLARAVADAVAANGSGEAAGVGAGGSSDGGGAGGGGIRFTVIVDLENLGARRLYERAGFVGGGQEKYVPRPRRGAALREKDALFMEYVYRPPGSAS